MVTLQAEKIDFQRGRVWCVRSYNVGIQEIAFLRGAGVEIYSSACNGGGGSPSPSSLRVGYNNNNKAKSNELRPACLLFLESFLQWVHNSLPLSLLVMIGNASHVCAFRVGKTWLKRRGPLFLLLLLVVWLALLATVEDSGRPEL